jgi:RHS repeat-associated protein
VPLVIDVLKSPDGKMETSFPSSRFLRLGEKTSQIVETCGVAQKVATLLFDANGNLTNDGAGKTYTYDAANRLSTITQSSGVTGFVYDGAGRRVQETLNGTLIKQWVWCGGAQPCEERDASNNVTRRFYTQGEQIGGTNYYFTKDHLGSVREMTDSTGAIRARYDYAPYGLPTKLSGDLAADFGFDGMYYHAASGLYLTWHRPYDPVLERWLSQDPIGEAGGINLYGFVENNPISRTDPLGLWWIPKGWHPSNAPMSPGTKEVITGGLIMAGSIPALGTPEIVGGILAAGAYTLGALQVLQGLTGTPGDVPGGPFEGLGELSENPNLQTFGSQLDSVIPWPGDPYSAILDAMNMGLNPPEYDPNYWPFAPSSCPSRHTTPRYFGK